MALVRISGVAATRVAAALRVPTLEPRVPRLALVRDAEGRVLDRALVTWFQAPASYTGEDVVEISCHGGALVPALILDAACAAGARVAEPGEFTRRAFLSGKLDLIQVEATLDLIEASSPAHHDAAMSQLVGALSARVDALRESLLALQATVAYDIDFPEEDEGPVDAAALDAGGRLVADRIAELLRYAPEGERLRDGALVVIAGAPNVGKSSIFNELVGRQRAIVTPTPGTTRDAIEADIVVEGYPFRLVDTAGVREGAEPIERMGIEVARGYLGHAELVLLCVEAGREPSAADARLAREVAARGATLLLVRTKSDVHGAGEARPAEALAGSPRECAVSTVTGEGVAALREALVEASFGLLRAAGEPPLVTRRRHVRGLQAAAAHVEEFRRLVRGGGPAEIASTHLQDAVAALESIVGVTELEEVLGAVFARFCVGK